ncbi:DUF305 domain-containing protein [Janibacter sp. DB-40]|uniref:DUF305 domain-containing protein n=1 Tax=Janibacter sp. DB-40 TaxID=3028808 RepID=UPI00240500FD|nr:DUF305 domain-containing protein [Janibacter sp. DB-40]
MSAKAIIAVVVALALGLVGGLALGSVGGSETPSDDSVAAGFARDMTTHHDQAVQMSWIVRTRTEDELVRSLAYDIARTQENQSGQMAGWLAAWGLSPTGPGEPMEWMQGLEHEHADDPDARLTDDGMMPGMASPEELEKLRSLSDKEAEVLFLQLMIRHHKAGVPMAQAALDHSANEAVENLARSIIASQTTEVETMTQMLRERGAKPLD